MKCKYQTIDSIYAIYLQWLPIYKIQIFALPSGWDCCVFQSRKKPIFQGYFPRESQYFLLLPFILDEAKLSKYLQNVLF